MADASAALRRSRCPGGEAAIREPWRIASGFMGLPEAEGLEGFAEDMDALFGVDGKHAIPRRHFGDGPPPRPRP